ncbi:uncharacterized protein LOC133890861 isoform X5 [Phragmites australis]|uniref:uncharacterized protein LOC133890861 isoform X5 n=1 Tax=Phragmites australis TaxID=29695 RepID=UPI002D798902|nr:uncharacterized protein LOC133890861 isoform X5 [Phragmites australis]
MLANASAAMSSPPPDDGAEAGGDGDRTFSYGAAEYWDARYAEEGGAPYDWYQRYDALRPFVRRFAPPASRLLMIGCGSALMSEDMVSDGYVEIVNIDISSVVIEMMRKKYFNVPQMQCILYCLSFPLLLEDAIYHQLIPLWLADLRMDVRDMSMFSDDSFDCAIDKGTLDSLMCGVDAPLSAAQMVLEVDRLLRPGGVFILRDRVSRVRQEGLYWILFH